MGSLKTQLRALFVAAATLIYLGVHFASKESCPRTCVGTGTEPQTMLLRAAGATMSSRKEKSKEQARFTLSAWKRGNGGLVDEDRLLLARIYSQASSVFEFGLGESTRIAGAIGVPRFAGVDSDAKWVEFARSHSPPHFSFYFADVGETKPYGFPAQEYEKSIYNYQLAPLISQLDAFDVYLVDGRWRIGCMLLSFLHAAALGQQNPQVLLHDCAKSSQDQDPPRAAYHKASDILELVEHSGKTYGKRRGRMCVWRRKPKTTNEDIFQRWLLLRHEVW